jgi:hypothetical protein
MGSLRKIRSEGTKEHRADELDRMDLAYGVPPEGLTLVLLDKDVDTILVTFQARRSNFLEKIRKAWHDCANHPQFSGKPAEMAVRVLAHRGNREYIVYLSPDSGHGKTPGPGWWIHGEAETQEAADSLWDEAVKMWAAFKEDFPN